MNYHQPDQNHAAVAGPRPLRLYAIGGAVLALVLGGYWYYTHDDGAAPKRRNLAAPVRVAIAIQRDMAVVEHTIGTVVANSTVSVTSRVQGQLVRAAFKEGDLVKQGDLLFEVDPRPYKAAYDNAYATMVSAKAKTDRYARLIKESAIAPQDADDAQAAYLEAAANTEAAALNLEFTKIRAPIDGKTGPILLQPGNLVSSSGTPVPLVTITQIQPIKVSFSLPQSDLPRIQARARQGGLTASIALRDQGGEDISAPVDFVSNAVGGNSGTIELRASFANRDSALVPGQLVDVTVALANIKNAIVVPRQAVNTGPDSQFVYTVGPDHVAEQRPVKVLFDDSTSMAIAGAVAPGDMVIVEGQLRVLPDAPVAVTGSRGETGQHRAHGGDKKSIH